MQEFQKFDYQNNNEELLQNTQKINNFDEKENLSNEELQHNDTGMVNQSTNIHAIENRLNERQHILENEEELIIQQRSQNNNSQGSQDLLRQLFVDGSQINKTALQYISQYKQIKCFFMIFSILMQIISLGLGMQLTNIIGCIMYNLNFVDQYFHESIESLIRQRRMSNFRKKLTNKGLRQFNFINKIKGLKNISTTQIRKHIFLKERNYNFAVFGIFFIISELLIIREAFKVYE